MMKRTEREATRKAFADISLCENKEISDSYAMRLKRWKQKMRNSPLGVDLVQEDKERRSRIDRFLRGSNRTWSEVHKIDKHIEQVVIEQEYLENPMVMSKLRREKRDLLVQLHQLRAMRDVEKSNSRITIF